MFQVSDLVEGPRSRTVRICGICAMRVIPWASFPHNYRALVSCSFGVAVYAYGEDMKIVRVRQNKNQRIEERDPEMEEARREDLRAVEQEAYPMGVPEPYENDLENLRNRELDEDRDAEIESEPEMGEGD